MEVTKGLEGASTEMVERSKTIFFPGDPAERVYLIRRGAVGYQEFMSQERKLLLHC